MQTCNAITHVQNQYANTHAHRRGSMSLASTWRVAGAQEEYHSGGGPLPGHLTGSEHQIAAAKAPSLRPALTGCQSFAAAHCRSKTCQHNKKPRLHVQMVDQGAMHCCEGTCVKGGLPPCFVGLWDQSFPASFPTVKVNLLTESVDPNIQPKATLMAKCQYIDARIILTCIVIHACPLVRETAPESFQNSIAQVPLQQLHSNSPSGVAPGPGHLPAGCQQEHEGSGGGGCRQPEPHLTAPLLHAVLHHPPISLEKSRNITGLGASGGGGDC